MITRTSNSKSPHTQLTNRLLPALITGLGLALATSVMDFALGWLGTSASKIILNDLVIGTLGGLAVYFYLGASQQRENYEFAKERVRMIEELNLRVREALEMMANSAMSEDRSARLRGIDEANERMDNILSDISVKPEAEEKIDTHLAQLESRRQ